MTSCGSLSIVNGSTEINSSNLQLAMNRRFIDRAQGYCRPPEAALLVI